MLHLQATGMYGLVRHCKMYAGLSGLVSHMIACQGLGPAWARDDMMTRASHAVLLLNYNF